MTHRVLSVGSVWMLPVFLLAVVPAGQAREPGPANVPPTQEIEILDPGVDPEGRPAVLIDRSSDGETTVDIPPVVLVHRFYYSGDRSFQGPMLPGGPSILVVNHPKTGERLYVEAQMMPGAPRVTYTRHGIEYDYGEHAVSLRFGLLGKPKVMYRSGTSWSERVGRVLHVQQLKSGMRALNTKTKTYAGKSKTMLSGAGATVSGAASTAALPFKNLARMMPLGPALFGGDLGGYLAQRAAEQERARAIQRAEHRSRVDSLDYATNR